MEQDQKPFINKKMPRSQNLMEICHCSYCHIVINGVPLRVGLKLAFDLTLGGYGDTKTVFA